MLSGQKISIPTPLKDHKGFTTVYLCYFLWMFIISNFITIICFSSYSYKIFGKLIWWNFTTWSQPYSLDRYIVQIKLPQLHQYCLVRSCAQFRNHNACPLYFLTLTHFADDSISCCWGFVAILLNFQGCDTKISLKWIFLLVVILSPILIFTM